MPGWVQTVVLASLQVIIVCEEKNDHKGEDELQVAIRSGATYTIPSGVTHTSDLGVPWFVWLLVIIFIMFVTFVATLWFIRCSDSDSGDDNKLCYLCYSRVAASNWKLHRQSCMTENNEILDKMNVNNDAKCDSCGSGLRLWPSTRVSPFTCGNNDCSHSDKPVMTIRYNCFPCDFDLCGKCASIYTTSEPSELVKLAAKGREMLSPLLLAAEPIILSGQSTDKPYPEPQVGMLVDLDSADGCRNSVIMDTREAIVAYPAQDYFKSPISPLAASSRNCRRGGSLRARPMPRRMSPRRQSLGDRRHQGLEDPMGPQYAMSSCDRSSYSPPLSPHRPGEDMTHMQSPYRSPPRRLSNFDTQVPRHSIPMSPRHGNVPRRQSPPTSSRQAFNFDDIPSQSPLRQSPPRGNMFPRHTTPMSPRGDFLPRHTPPMSPRGDFLPRNTPPMSPRRLLNADILARQSSRPLNHSEDRWSEQHHRIYGASQIEEGDLEADSSYPGMHCRRNPLYLDY